MELRGWKCVLGGVSVHLVLGTLYLWSNITTAVTAHLRAFDETVTYEKTLLVFATALGVQGCFMLLGGLIERRFGARKTVLVGGYILTLGTFLASTATSLFEVMLYNGVFFGVGLGICYTPPITCSMKWLPGRKGFVTGCIVAGFGFGAFVFGFIATKLVNPNGESIPKGETGSRGFFAPDSDVAKRVPRMFIVLGCCYFCLVSFAGWCLQEPTEVEELEIQQQGGILENTPGPDRAWATVSLNDSSTGGSSSSMNEPVLPVAARQGYNPLFLGGSYQTDSHTQGSGGKSLENDTSALSRSGIPPPGSKTLSSFEVSPAELVCLPLAWHLSSCLIFTTVGGMYLAGTFKTYGLEDFPTDESFLSTVASLSSIFNAGGRIFWGALADRFGAVQTCTFMALGFALVIYSYPASSFWGGREGFGCWTFLVFFFEGGNFALYPSICTNLFGVKNSGANYAVVFWPYSVCVVINIVLLAHNSVSFDDACLAMGVLTFAGFANLLLLQNHIRNVACKPRAE